MVQKVIIFRKLQQTCDFLLNLRLLGGGGEGVKLSKSLNYIAYPKCRYPSLFCFADVPTTPFHDIGR